MSGPAEGDGRHDSSGSRSPLEMPADVMLELARVAAERVVGRIQTLPDDAPWKGASREELEPRFREPPPEKGLPALEVLERAVTDILSVAGRVDHPRYFAFVPSSPTWPGVIADFLASGYNTFQGTWLNSSGPSQVELVVIDWFRQWVGYPESAGGLFTSGGSAASLDAFVAAREQAGSPDRAAVFLSDQSHSALERAARIIGVRRDRIRKVASDELFRLRIDDLEQKVREARREGLTPIAVSANAGTTNTGSVDPLGDMADFCAREGIWLHVDAAYGGFSVLSDRGRFLLHGIERADSITMDAHKWLFQPFEAGCLVVKDVRLLERTFSVHPEYLQDTDLGRDQVNFADRGLQLTRSFRALKVWMSVQTFGMEAFRSAVSRGIELADRASDYVKASELLEMLCPASLGIVCFRANPRDSELDEGAIETLNARIQDRVIATETAMMSSTRLRGRYSLRLCIMNHLTIWRDVEETLGMIERFLLEEMKQGSMESSSRRRR